MSYIMIDNNDYSEVYEIDTGAGLLAAQHALRDAGIKSAPVYVGDPNCPDTYKSGQTLFAAEAASLSVPRLALNSVYRYRYGNTPGNVPLDDVSDVGLPAGQTWEEICCACGFDPDDEEVFMTCLTADWSATGRQPVHHAGDYVVTGLQVEGHPFAVIPVDHDDETDDETDDEQSNQNEEEEEENEIERRRYWLGESEGCLERLRDENRRLSAAGKRLLDLGDMAPGCQCPSGYGCFDPDREQYWHTALRETLEL